MMAKQVVLILALVSSIAVSADVFTKLKSEVEKKGVNGNPAFVGDYASINGASTVANIYKLPPCSTRECSFDFSSNSKASDNELFTCSLPADVKINFANNGKGYLFLESPKTTCSLRLEMKDKNILKVSEISCPQAKLGDCDKSFMLGEFSRLGRPSFDCGVLTPYLELSPARRTICHNLDLSEIDKNLETMYERVREMDEGRKAETQFLRKRESCGANVACLTETFQKWREHLKSLEFSSK